MEASVEATGRPLGGHWEATGRPLLRNERHAQSRQSLLAGTRIRHSEKFVLLAKFQISTNSPKRTPNVQRIYEKGSEVKLLFVLFSEVVESRKSPN